MSVSPLLSAAAPRKSLRRVLALLIGASLATGSTAYATPMASGGDGLLTPAAIAAYQQTNNRSLAEAEAAIALQDRIAPYIDAGIAALGTEFGGSWFDATDQGRLHLGVVALSSSKNATAATAVFHEAGVIEDVRLVDSQVSWNDLIAAHAAFSDRLASLYRTGQLTSFVTPRDGALQAVVTLDMKAEDLAAVKSAGSVAGVPFALTRSSAISLSATPTNCAYLSGSFSGSQLFCGNPLRGGVTIGTPSFGCTAGLMTKSRSNGIPYVLTAGHCLRDDHVNTWNSRTDTGTLHSVGDAHSWTFGADGDFGIVRIANSYWTPDGYVFVSGSSQTTQDSLYEIHGAIRSSVGSVICITSGPVLLANGRHTTCGSVTRLDVTVNYSGTIVSHLGEADACSGVQGSSGGPYYKAGYGYGIQSGTRGTCDVFYQGLIGALSGSNVELYTR